MRFIVVILIAVGLHTGCESCEFTFGVVEVTGHLIVKGSVPADLVLQTCTSARADDCMAAVIIDNGARGHDYLADIPSEGVATCSFAHHWLVASGTGCETTAIDALELNVSDRDHADLTLHCEG